MFIPGGASDRVRYGLTLGLAALALRPLLSGRDNATKGEREQAPDRMVARLKEGPTDDPALNRRLIDAFRDWRFFQRVRKGGRQVLVEIRLHISVRSPGIGQEWPCRR